MRVLGLELKELGHIVEEGEEDDGQNVTKTVPNAALIRIKIISNCWEKSKFTKIYKFKNIVEKREEDYGQKVTETVPNAALKKLLLKKEFTKIYKFKNSVKTNANANANAVFV